VPVTLHSYENVPVSTVPFNPAAGWHLVPCRLLVDWVALVERVARAIAPAYAAAPLPDPVVFAHEIIPSDGPYPSREDWYQLSWFHLTLPGLRIAFERGRHGGGEPLEVATTGLEHNVSSFMDPVAQTPPRARVFVWHEDAQTPAVRRALGVA
jgi:hypothetical protein